MSLYLVGGSIRDMLMESPAKDLDLVVEGDAALLASMVSEEIGGDFLSHAQFGTATVHLEGQRFDLATARQETYEHPGALPTVNPSSIHEDLARRDFSVNSMAIALSGPEAGQLLDPHNGVEDLKHRLIRVLHPKSFVDDATRVLRAVRYEQRLDFQLETETQELMVEALEKGMLDTLSGDRIRRELELVLEEEQPPLPLLRCGELGILRAIYPPLEDGPEVKALAGRVIEDVPMTYLAALSYPLTQQEGEAFIHRMPMPSSWVRVVRDTIMVRLKISCDSTDHPSFEDPNLLPSEIYAMFDRFSPTSLEVNGWLSDSPTVRRALNSHLTEWRYVKPILNGDEIVSMGIPEGPLVGQILTELRNARIDGKITTRDDEIRLVEQHFEAKGD